MLFNENIWSYFQVMDNRLLGYKETPRTTNETKPLKEERTKLYS